MRDFHPHDREGARHTRTTQIRHDEALGDLISAAATSLGVEKSVFLRAAIAREAARVLEAGSRHVLTPEDAERFAAALDAPPPPTARAREAAKLYRRRVVHAD
jgi:uncharacterized protein (DUF1778 family)